MDVDQLELDELRDLVRTLRAELGGFRQEQLTMVQQEKELKEGILELQSYLKSHPALAASPVLPPSSPPASTPLYTHILPNPPMPQKFGGNSREYMNFLMQCKLHFLNRPDVYNTDSSKVLFVLMNLEGNALRWAHPFINQDHRMLRDYDVFSRMFAKMFECKREKEIKQNELIEHRQGRRETQEYLTHFQMLASSTGWPDSVLIKLFYRGLRDDIKDMLSNMLTLPTVFSEYTTLTIQIDQRLHERKKEKQEPTFQKGKQEPAVNPHIPQPMEEQVNIDSTDIEEPMQIGSCYTHSPPDHDPGRSNGLCSDYGSDRQYIDQCPSYPRRNTNTTVPRRIPAMRITNMPDPHVEVPQTRHISSIRLDSASKEVMPVSSRPRVPARFSSEKERRYAERLCYYCGDAEHYIASCPLRPPRNPRSRLSSYVEHSSVQTPRTTDIGTIPPVPVFKEMEANLYEPRETINTVANELVKIDKDQDKLTEELQTLDNNDLINTKERINPSPLSARDYIPTMEELDSDSLKEDPDLDSEDSEWVDIPIQKQTKKGRIFKSYS